MLDRLLRHRDVARTVGICTKQFETWRDPAVQAAHFAKGRNAAGMVILPGAVITNARPGRSWHNLTIHGTPAALAYHLGIKLPGGGIYGLGDSKIGPAGIKVLTALGMIGEQLGLRWGGRWKSRDYTHFEFLPAKGVNIIKVAEWIRAGRPLDEIRRR